MSKTKKMMSGVLGAAALVSLSACGDERPAAPTGTDCDDWEWDSSTESYYCDDDGSSRSGFYYYGGRYYNSKNKLTNSSIYKNNSYSNSSFKSGIGTGTKGGFGG